MFTLSLSLNNRLFSCPVHSLDSVIDIFFLSAERVLINQLHHRDLIFFPNAASFPLNHTCHFTTESSASLNKRKECETGEDLSDAKLALLQFLAEPLPLPSTPIPCHLHIQSCWAVKIEKFHKFGFFPLQTWQMAIFHAFAACEIWVSFSFFSFASLNFRTEWRPSMR